MVPIREIGWGLSDEIRWSQSVKSTGPNQRKSCIVESAVNQVVSKRLVKKQQMRWTPTGAHQLLQVRARVLNQQLRGDFERWHPELRSASDRARLAA